MIFNIMCAYYVHIWRILLDYFIHWLHPPKNVWYQHASRNIYHFNHYKTDYSQDTSHHADVKFGQNLIIATTTESRNVHASLARLAVRARHALPWVPKAPARAPSLVRRHRCLLKSLNWMNLGTRRTRLQSQLQARSIHDDGIKW